MKRPIIAFIVPLLLVVSEACAAEMFEAYPKQYSLGYVSDDLNLRYWFNPAWGLDMSVGFEDRNANARSDDGVVSSHDRSDSDSYSLSVAAVRTLRNYEYFDLNLKAGVSYSHGKAHTDPEGPDNDATQRTKSYSLYVGPEVEIKLPYFSRLVIVSSIQAAYVVDKEDTEEATISGTTSTKQDSKTFTLRSDGNSLDEFFHIGVRYYF